MEGEQYLLLSAELGTHTFVCSLEYVLVLFVVTRCYCCLELSNHLPWLMPKVNIWKSLYII